MQAIRNLLRASMPYALYRPLRIVDHWVRARCGVADPGWEMCSFEFSFPESMRRRHSSVLRCAESAASSCLSASGLPGDRREPDPAWELSEGLKRRVETQFLGVLAKSGIRAAVHVPDPMLSPAGWSAFTNLADAFAFVGIPTRIMCRATPMPEVFADLRPNLLISGDHWVYRDDIDWGFVESYRRAHGLVVGLGAWTDYHERPAVEERVAWGLRHGVAFYFSFRDPEYLRGNPAFSPYAEAGFPVLSLPFGANVRLYHPVPGVTRDLPYVFLASQNSSKCSRYRDFLGPIVSRHDGFVHGPGWRHVRRFGFDQRRDCLVYARARAGLNIHLNEQIQHACEVNERTFQLAACGVPQVIDNPALLPKLFSPGALLIASTPEEYVNHFERVLADPEHARNCALLALREVFERHTTYHRAVDFVERLRAVELIP